MFLLTADNAEQYLRQSGRIALREQVAVRELKGGVSNLVLYVDRSEGADFVLKQSRDRLRVADEWLCPLERIWREAEVLRICDQLLCRGGDSDLDAAPHDDGPSLAIGTPAIVFEDRENYVLAITAAAPDHTVWKSDLLAGRADPRIAEACGDLLARLHAGSWLSRGIAQRIGDRSLFEQLRLDPYYRTAAARRPEFRAPLDALYRSVWDHPLALVHADFSPKNLLVSPQTLMMVDFETGHFGDPAFDLGFFLSHLVLKALYHAPSHLPMLALIDAFWARYEPRLLGRIGGDEYRSLVARGLQNLAGCAVARLDGKSPVEYLESAPRRDAVRRLAGAIFNHPPNTWAELRDAVDAVCATLAGE